MNAITTHPSPPPLFQVYCRKRQNISPGLVACRCSCVCVCVCVYVCMCECVCLCSCTYACMPPLHLTPLPLPLHLPPPSPPPFYYTFPHPSPSTSPFPPLHLPLHHTLTLNLVEVRGYAGKNSQLHLSPPCQTLIFLDHQPATNMIIIIPNIFLLETKLFLSI